MKKLDIKIEHKKTFVVACVAWFIAFIYLGVIEAQSIAASFPMCIASTIAVSALDVRNDIRTNLVFALFPVNLFLPCLSTGIVYMINGQEGMSVIKIGFIAAMVIAIPQLAFCLYNKKKGLNIDGIPLEHQDHPEEIYDVPYRNMLLEECNSETSLCFTINMVLTYKAYKRRVRHERKWIIPRMMRFWGLPICIVSAVIAIFFVPYENSDLGGKLFLLSAIGFFLFLIGFGVIFGVASYGVMSRGNEQLWLNREKGTLNHFIQTDSFANYLQTPHTEGTNTIDITTGILNVMLIDSIHDAIYDPKSGRIEFKTCGKQYHFYDFKKNLVNKEKPLDDEFTAVFYEYTDPSLVEVLEAEGVKFTRCRLNKYSIYENY